MFGTTTRSGSPWKRIFWPDVDDAASARSTSRQGMWAALLVCLITLGYAVLVQKKVIVLVALYAIIYALLAWGIRQVSRAAAVLALLLYVGERVLTLLASPTAVVANLITLLFTIAFVNGVRGSFAYARLRTK